jgi:hypothetical protein
VADATATDIPPATPTLENAPQQPSQPSLIAPRSVEAITDPSPVFVWMENPPSEFVTQYQLVVKNAAGKRVYVGKIPATSCSGGMCSLDMETSDVRLKNGSYTWRVQARNGQGKARSLGQVLVIEFPGISSLIEPSGGFETTDRAPMFTWSHVPAAAQYRLHITKNGKTVFSQWFDASVVNCNGEMCSIDLDVLALQLPRGALRWRVDTRTKPLGPNVSHSSWRRLRILRQTN